MEYRNIKWNEGESFAIEELIGKTLIGYHNPYATHSPINGEFQLFTDDGGVYEFYHSQDCCESVSIEEIIGDLDDLVGTPLLEAREDKNVDYEPEKSPEYSDGCDEWTFYNFRTIKGSVTIRWYGTSNGYYSTDVSMRKLKRV